VIAGTRIPVRLILDHLAEGYMPEEIIVEYPVLSRADIRAALRFASRAIEKIENGKEDTILDVKKYWGDDTVHDIHEQIIQAKIRGELEL